MLSQYNLIIIKVVKKDIEDQTQFYESELSQIEEDINIKNDGTIDELLLKLDYQLNNIKISNSFEYFKIIL